MSATAQIAEPAAPPNRVTRLLGVVRKLIEYGHSLAETFRAHAEAGKAGKPTPVSAARLKLLVTRLVLGIRLAYMLEADLKRREAEGEDITPSAELARPPMPSTRSGAASAPRGSADRTDARPVPADELIPPRIPTDAEFAVMLRRKPLGAVLVDICCDLGVTPEALGQAFWRELCNVILMHGGDMGRLLRNLPPRGYPFGEPAPRPPPTPETVPLATGPPRP